MRALMLDGSAPPNGQTIQVDHSVTEFKVVIRHLNSVGENDLKQLLQKKFEVVKIEKIDQTAYCFNCGSDFFD